MNIHFLLYYDFYNLKNHVIIECYWLTYWQNFKNGSSTVILFFIIINLTVVNNWKFERPWLRCRRHCDRLVSTLHIRRLTQIYILKTFTVLFTWYFTYKNSNLKRSSVFLAVLSLFLSYLIVEFAFHGVAQCLTTNPLYLIWPLNVGGA